MKIYIAGKWEEHKLIAEYAKELENRGHTITFPWFTKHLGETPLSVAATEDLQGVLDADVCIFVFERMLPYSGAMSELGVALGTGKEIYIIGDGGDRNVFTHHPRVKRAQSFIELLEEQWKLS